MMGKKFWAMLFFVFLFFPFSLHAENLQSALSKQINEKYGERFSFVEVLSMEKVGDKFVYVSEVSIQGKKKLRVPAKISRKNGSWKVDWIAKKEYLNALETLSISGQLGKVNATGWDSIARLPTFPVVLSSKRVITPFGVLAAPSATDKIAPMSVHASRWINEILEGDPALAAFEIITPKTTTWASVHEVMVTLAGTHGLFQMYLVGISEKATLNSSQFRTTVGTKMPTRIISLARSNEYEGLHIGVRDAKGVREITQNCPRELPEGKYCSPPVEPIPKIMEELFSTPLEKNERVILGFSADVRLEDVFQISESLSKKLGVKSDRFLVTLVVE